MQSFALMRRFIAATAALLFALQSSGSALASGSSLSPLQFSLRTQIAAALSSLQDTRLAAIITGNETRWTEMHAPPPSPGHSLYPDPALPPRTDGTRPIPVTTIVLSAPLHARPTLPASINASPMFALPRPVVRPTRAPQRSVHVRTFSVNVASAGTTGINPWWTYEEAGVPGSGRYMVNVANGNLIVQDDDMDVPNADIDLAFRRTYNSQSQHDYANTDGSVPSIYGDGWTNTWDAHIASNSSGGLSVFDIDGARYDYTGSDAAGWSSATPGQHATLTLDQTSGLYDWTKKSGTVYVFYSPSYATGGLAGRLDEILGRNHNNYVAFTYGFSPDNTTPLNTSSITATTEGDATHHKTATLTFGGVTYNGVTYRLLSSLTYPDSSTKVTYSYALGTDLGAVVQASYNSSGTLPKIGYGWNSGHQLNHISSPRYEASTSDGAVYYFFYAAGTNAINQIDHEGVMNPPISDGTGQQLQPGYSQALSVFSKIYYTQPASGQEEVKDSDGHDTTYSYDSVGRITQRKAYTGESSPTYLITSASWDSSNNLTETVDARGNATDYGYDGNGNALWVQGPSVQTSLGAGRPVSRYSYDRFNNVTSYCDAQYIWTSGATTCPVASGTTHYTWNSSDSSEPYGCLTDTYKPLGYHVRLTYAGSTSCGSSGLPTQAQGDPISQPIDGSTPTRTPTQTFAYDIYGNLTSYSNGIGTTTLAYDAYLNRLISVTDPDGYTSYRYYYANGDLSKTETAYQHATGTGPSFTYDADGDLIQENSYHAGSYNSASTLPTLPSAVTQTLKYYDGADHLVEVQQARDASGTGEAYTNPWITRYIYDLSQNHTVTGQTPTVGGQTVVAYGNLYKTEELVPTSDVATFSNTALTAANTTFHELKGNAFDALDRAVTRYFFVTNGTSDVLQHETYGYDAANPISNNNAGELSSTLNGLGQYTYYAYDNDGKVVQTQHTASPALDRQLTYDPDGRPTAITVTSFGSQTYAYDADGRETQSAEPTGMESAATISYEYYLDGTRKALDVSSAFLNQTGLFAYAYRTDGKLETQQINQPSNALVGTTTLTFSYSNAGRLKQRAESGPGGNATPTQYQYNTSYGFLAEKDFPGGNKEMNIQFDPSGAALGETSNWSTSSTYSLTVRGELRTTTGPTATNQPPPAVNIMANGVAVNTNYKVSKTLATASWSANIDPRMGVVLGSSATDTGGDGQDQSVGFDAIGRATADRSDSIPSTSCDTCKETDSVTNRTYDQEEHVVTTNEQQCSAIGPCTPGAPYANATYDWGAEGHPIRIGISYKGSATNHETLHWAGNQLLFTTHGGVLDDIKIGELGDITPQDSTYKGLTFWDRDVSSNVVYCHNATGAAGNGTPAFPYSTGYRNASVEYTHNPCALAGSESMTIPSTMFWGSVAYSMANGSPPLIGSGGLLTMPRGDGFNDGLNLLQGARIYDSTLGGWATPDAYQGNVHDPMSQKSYVWNRSNASAYADPRGYDAALFYDGYGAQSGDAVQDAPDFSVKEDISGIGDCDVYGCATNFSGSVTTVAFGGSSEVGTVTARVDADTVIATAHDAIAAVESAAARTMEDIKSGIISVTSFWGVMTGWTNVVAAKANYNFYAATDGKSMSVNSPEVTLHVTGGSGSIAISGTDLVHDRPVGAIFVQQRAENLVYFLEMHLKPNNTWSALYPWMGAPAGGYLGDAPSGH